MNSNVRHSSQQPKWGTPLPVVDVALSVLCCASLGDQITVDPFSEPEFNAHVKANYILDGATRGSGFKDRWLLLDGCPRADQLLANYPLASTEKLHLTTALVNPPGDDDGDNVKRAWRLLDEYHHLGWLGGGAIWVAFNLNQFQTLQNASARVGRHPLSLEFEGLRCVPDHRLAFTRHSSTPTHKPDPKTGQLVEVSDAPSHPCFFMLLPSHNDVIAAEQRRLFDSHASKLGAVF
jgi:hypothetical protein